mmetsp:Transcript_16099/g.18047  ORF Transcript_16099/g.18047 Transcript_16099/m.18047 type:complete len:170 (-) Transcript_16099:48-557(-)
MTIYRFVKKSLLVLVATTLLVVYNNAATGVSAMKSNNGNEYMKGVFGSLKDHYDHLSVNGKCATCAALGFTGSRLVVKSSMTVVKVAGAAFIATEVMEAFGVLENIPEFSGEQQQMMTMVKGRVIQSAKEFRTGFRNEVCNPNKIENFVKQEPKSVIMGAAGAMAGLLL